MRFFNTSGPVVADDHYCIPPLDRLNLSAVRRFVREKRYFVLHAPRQTGKTSVLLTLRDLLNAEGDYRCVYVNVEGGQAGREDAQQVVRTLLGTLALRASARGRSCYCRLSYSGSSTAAGGSSANTASGGCARIC